ncbi:hypothetical protein L249_2522, partial [Ophiocordyceps polyrhachis-furcata BCC 54312]
KNVGKKWVYLLKSVGKVESNKVFCGAVEEEEGGKKLVEIQRVDRLQRADRCDGCLVPRLIGCYNCYRYSAPIAVTIAVTSRFGRYNRYSPTVT